MGARLGLVDTNRKCGGEILRLLPQCMQRGWRGLFLVFILMGMGHGTDYGYSVARGHNLVQRLWLPRCPPSP